MRDTGIEAHVGFYFRQAVTTEYPRANPLDANSVLCTTRNSVVIRSPGSVLIIPVLPSYWFLVLVLAAAQPILSIGCLLFRLPWPPRGQPGPSSGRLGARFVNKRGPPQEYSFRQKTRISLLYTTPLHFTPHYLSCALCLESRGILMVEHLRLVILYLTPWVCFIVIHIK